MVKIRAKAEAQMRRARGRRGEGARGIRGVHGFPGAGGAAGPGRADEHPRRLPAGADRASRSWPSRPSTTAARSSIRATAPTSTTHPPRRRMRRAARRRSVPSAPPASPRAGRSRRPSRGDRVHAHRARRANAARGRRERAPEPALSAHPEHVFGVYRVPDRFDHKPQRRGQARTSSGRSPTARARMRRRATTVHHRRVPPATRTGSRAGRASRSVLDEDVAGHVRRPRRPRARGLLRHHPAAADRRQGQPEDGRSVVRATSRASLVVSRPRPRPRPPASRMLAEAPLALAARPALPFHLEILDWEAVAAWVSPYRWGAQRIPSPLPHLPSTRAS